MLAWLLCSTLKSLHVMKCVHYELTTQHSLCTHYYYVNNTVTVSSVCFYSGLYSMYRLLLLSLLLHITTGSVYNVIPDDHYYTNTTCRHCHNLQHYFLNATKYFTSNTQLLLLPGLHHLHTNLIIQNVHNISLIGRTTNSTTPDTVIQCNSSVGIVMTNITNLIVTDITVRSCLGNEYNNATVLIKQCTNVQLRHVVIKESHNSYGIVGINILGDSHFSYITINAMIIIYNDTTVIMENNSFIIDHYCNSIRNKIPQVAIKFNQQTYKVTVTLINYSSIQLIPSKTTIFQIHYNNSGVGNSNVRIKSCLFSKNYNQLFEVKVFKTQEGNSLWIENCSVFNNFFNNSVFNNSNFPYLKLIVVKGDVDVHIINYHFKHNHNILILKKELLTKLPGGPVKLSKVTITNTVFSSNTGVGQNCKEFFILEYVDLHLRGPLTFKNMSKSHSVIRLKSSNIICSNYIEFVNINAISFFRYAEYRFLYTNFSMFIRENTTINVSQSDVYSFVDISSPAITQLYEYPLCYFQYLSEAPLHDQYSSHNYSIILDANNKRPLWRMFKNIPTTHCRWLTGTAFKTAMPFEVNSKYMKYLNQSGIYHLSSKVIVKKKSLCFCNAAASHNCYKDLLDAIYPGQSITLNIYPEISDIPEGFEYFDSTIVTVVNDTDWLPPTACVVTNSSELTKTIKNGVCTSLKYTIAFTKEGWCELYLKRFPHNGDIPDIYYIKQLPCPPGFIKEKENGVCECPSFLRNFNITCNINDQTLLRPANIWIALPHKNLSHYSLSINCPFHYCIPHSLHLKYSIPNAQCQFKRSGILCGHCQKGLSTVLGSSHCQKCSNVHLFLVVPIAVTGLVLVLILFILNLTVTDGTINPFILYVNIISINAPVFFPQGRKLTPAYTFISLANLDLGIQTCFYNGMDDYTKMWLQLAFPFYLILIATSFIITSRYSTTIQRLTRRRALPVLATLFLLSYTKILLTVSTVLFYYSKVIDLPGEQTTMVWSVDANVPLFGVKFTILFIACIVLCFILIPFNIILLFTRTLSRFKLISKFKPILDAYQGPYKDEFYYWTGAQLVIRIIFYGISSLDRNINLTIGIVLFTTMAMLQGWIRPFKLKFKNLNESFFTINLQLLFVILLYGQDVETITNTMVTIAVVHFTLIVIYHIVTYINGGVIKHLVEKITAKVNTQLTMLFNRGQVRYIQNEEDIHAPDKVCFNVMREPLIEFV